MRPQRLSELFEIRFDHEGRGKVPVAGEMGVVVGRRLVDPARQDLEDTPNQTRPKIDAGDASLPLRSIH